MNERIIAIGRQVGFAFIEDGVYGQRWYSSKCGMDASEFEKFAELIVRECAKTIEAQDVDPSFKLRMSWAIKTQFGVEQ